MRVGVIRGDLPGPISFVDLGGSVSQWNPTTEPEGQERGIARPSIASVTAALARIGAGAEGTTDITNGKTIDGTNNVLRLRTSATGQAFVITVAQGAYQNAGALVIAVNNAIKVAGADVVAKLSGDGDHLVIQARKTGPGSYLDIAGTGSTFLAAVGLAAGGANFPPPSPADVIAATSPVGGPIDVSAATLTGLVGQGASADQLALLADAIAPYVAETDAAIQSYLVGQLSGALAMTFNPDPSRRPALANGPAIAVVQDDGVTGYDMPGVRITAAVHNAPSAGAITITGTSLGTVERDDTKIRVYAPNGARSVQVLQSALLRPIPGPTQGAISRTSIVIPALYLRGLGVAGAKVIVQYTSIVSNIFTVT